MQEESLKPKVGIGIMILRDGKVLLGKRKGSHGEGEYAFPGGHLEYGESFLGCVERELEEECGVRIKNIRFQLLANLDHYMPKHYVHIGIVCDWDSGEAEVREIDKCEFWDWYDMDNLPEPIFEAVKYSIDSYKTGKNYYDLGDDYYKKQIK